MRMSIALPVALLLGALWSGEASTAIMPNRNIVSVRIEVTSFGLGGSAGETFQLTPQGGDFILEGAKTEQFRLAKTPKPTITPIKKQKVSGALVRALAAATNAAPVSRAAGIGQLTSQQWLDTSSDAAYATLFPDHTACSPEARKLFVTRYRTRAASVAATNAYYDRRWTDNGGHAEVTVRYSDGKTITVKSYSQQDPMLPWRNGKVETWNPEIASSVAALLPRSSDYRRSFTTDPLVEGLASQVKDSVAPKWEDLEGRCQYRRLIAKISPHYNVSKVFQTGPDFSATLTKEGMPKNLVIDARLPGGETQAARAAFNRFLQKMPVYIEVARPFVTANPSIKFELWYSKGTSFEFEEDEVYGDEAAVEWLRHQPRRDEGVLLRDTNLMRRREWVVLPGGKSVLWKAK